MAFVVDASVVGSWVLADETIIPRLSRRRSEAAEG